MRDHHGTPEGERAAVIERLLFDPVVVIFKERGLEFPTNFDSIGHIECDEDRIEAKTSDLLAELIALGLIKVTVS